MSLANNCPYCDPKQEYRKLAKSETVFVMYPKSPAIPHHLLIIPIRHVQTLDNLTEAEIIDVHNYIKKFVRLGSSNIKDFVGFNILSNNGSPQVSQQVKHCHVHLFLRSKEDIDPIKSEHTSAPKDLSSEELKVLEKIRTWL